MIESPFPAPSVQPTDLKAKDQVCLFESESNPQTHYVAKGDPELWILLSPLYKQQRKIKCEGKSLVGQMSLSLRHAGPVSCCSDPITVAEPLPHKCSSAVGQDANSRLFSVSVLDCSFGLFFPDTTSLTHAVPVSG